MENYEKEIMERIGDMTMLKNYEIYFIIKRLIRKEVHILKMELKQIKNMYTHSSSDYSSDCLSDTSSENGDFIK